MNASKSCRRSLGRVIVDSLEGIRGRSGFPDGSEALAGGAAGPVAMDLGLLLGVAGETLDCFGWAPNWIVIQTNIQCP